jgi:hypothetical protein
MVYRLTEIVLLGIFFPLSEVIRLDLILQLLGYITQWPSFLYVEDPPSLLPHHLVPEDLPHRLLLALLQQRS